MAPAQKVPKGARIPQSSKPITDPRFSNIHTDPRFRLPSKRHTKVKLDKRFAHMLKDDDFSKKANVDRYGRKIEKGTGRKDLERFYRLGDDDEDDENEDDGNNLEDDEADDDDEVRKEMARVDRKYDPAREGGFSESSSDEESSDEEEEEEIDMGEEDLASDADVEVPTGEVSARLAAVNLDWDHIRAVDLMAVASSFAPADGKILKVAIYPSEFGREQLEREELEGPPAELFGKIKSAKDKTQDIQGESEEDEDEDEADERIKKSLLQEDKGEEYSSTALRNYQLSRLRYYYAVLTCSSPAVAKALYDAMDSREYLTTSNFFDLRFVPDDTTFDQAPRDECTKVPGGYRPNEFTTDALTHSKVRLTWDADDAHRKEVQKRAFSRGEVEENDLKAYIGSDSSDDEDEAVDEQSRGKDENDVVDGEIAGKKSKADEKRQRMRALLGLSEVPSKIKRNGDAPVGDLQITFTSGLSTSDNKDSVFANKLVTEETTREKYIRKEKERKARKKAKVKTLREGKAQQDDDDVGDLISGSADEAEVDLAQQAPGIGDEQKEDPFEDPFFTDPKASAKAEATARKAAAKKKREEREFEEAAAAKKRAELELLMVDDKSTDGGTLRHFDMNEIERAEKAAKKKRKGKKGKKEDETKASGAPVDQFKMDVQDPRFAQLYDSHEFAIDPTNPRFKGTEGMKKLLEEGRKKRKSKGAAEKPQKRIRVEEDATEMGAAQSRDDLQRLVARVKGRTTK
ncbi:MAG: pre-rRNA-processing protein esf1 [Bathelium mastoideum]|nr:MAG: pre-rRNA-processing protein esf1 [Bathelium mastoideum]